jgi:hypothetical protein
MLVRRRLLGLILLSATAAFAQTGIDPVTHSVPFAHHHLGNPATVISAGFKLLPVVDGSVPIENPSGVITSFGFLSTGTPTEPDENTYLVFDSNPGGPTQGYDYGRHSFFRGMKIAATSPTSPV